MGVLRSATTHLSTSTSGLARFLANRSKPKSGLIKKPSTLVAKIYVNLHVSVLNDAKPFYNTKGTDLYLTEIF
jgi:hypothetical protein